jgi:cytochrome P450
MQTLDQLDLPYLAMDDPSFGKDPFTPIAAAKAVHPWLATSKFGIVVHDYRAMNELYRMEDKLRVPYAGIVELMGEQGTPWGRFTAQQLIALPEDQHKFIRETFAAKFTPRFASQLRPMMRETITALLDDWTPRGDMDFEEFASYFPIAVMFSLVGAPVSAIPGLRGDLEAIGLAHSLQKDLMPGINESMVRLEAFVEGVIAERRANPRSDGAEDLLSMMLDTDAGDKVGQRQLVDLIMFFFIAGYDTSKNVLTYTMYTLLDYPDIYRRCATDLDYCRKVVEEALRWFNPGTVTRIVADDLIYRDVLLPKDTMLFFPLSVSGRDSAVFADMQDFNPERPIDPNRRHIAFGLGKHMCLGQYIARAQLQESIHLIAQRMHDPHMAGPIGWRPFMGTWGLEGLPIRFTPAGEMAPA